MEVPILLVLVVAFLVAAVNPTSGQWNYKPDPAGNFFYKCHHPIIFLIESLYNKGLPSLAIKAENLDIIIIIFF